MWLIPMAELNRFEKQFTAPEKHSAATEESNT
jgi:hypothetical protein